MAGHSKRRKAARQEARDAKHNLGLELAVQAGLVLTLALSLVAAVGMAAG